MDVVFTHSGVSNYQGMWYVKHSDVSILEVENWTLYIKWSVMLGKQKKWTNLKYLGTVVRETEITDECRYDDWMQ